MTEPLPSQTPPLTRPLGVPGTRSLGPPLWAVLTLPFGLTVGFTTVAVPFLLRSRGLDMTAIAAVTQIGQLPHVFKLLWSPALDAGARRRSWYFGSIAVTATCLAATCLIPPSGGGHVLGVPMLWIYTAAIFMANAGVATSASAVLALIAATVPNARRGAASGWQTAGNLVGTATGGGMVAWMFAHLSRGATAVALGSMCCAAALPAAYVSEVPPPRRRALALIAQLVRDIGHTLQSRDGWTGLLLCLSPVGTGALTYLFSALARDYASDDAGAEHLVVVVNGLLGGVANAAGALAGGYVTDRMNRRLAYALFGALSAVCAVAMMVAPATGTAFTVGCLAYQTANGLSYAAFYAFVLELVGHREGVTTQLALYVGASNLAINYVTFLDGWSYDRIRTWKATASWSPRTGMLGMDALATFAGLALLAATVGIARRRLPRIASPIQRPAA